MLYAVNVPRAWIGTGSMCDPYMPLEKSELMTRQSLKLVDRYNFGITLITKSDLVLRDIDILKSINSKTKCVVQMTLTTYDEDICHILEPNVCTTTRRIETLKILNEEGIPTIVWLSPILPFINDTEENLRGILDACFRVGVKGIICFGMGVTLRLGDREYFYNKLDEHFPSMKERYIKSFGNSYQCNSPNNEILMEIFRNECHVHNVLYTPKANFEFLNLFEDKQAGEQLNLF